MKMKQSHKINTHIFQKKQKHKINTHIFRKNKEANLSEFPPILLKHKTWKKLFVQESPYSENVIQKKESSKIKLFHNIDKQCKKMLRNRKKGSRPCSLHSPTGSSCIQPYHCSVEVGVTGESHGSCCNSTFETCCLSRLLYLAITWGHEPPTFQSTLKDCLSSWCSSVMHPLSSAKVVTVDQSLTYVNHDSSGQPRLWHARENAEAPTICAEYLREVSDCRANSPRYCERESLFRQQYYFFEKQVHGQDNRSRTWESASAWLRAFDRCNRRRSRTLGQSEDHLCRPPIGTQWPLPWPHHHCKRRSCSTQLCGMMLQE